MASKSKSWKEKLEDNKGLPKVELIAGNMTKRWGEGTIVIPAPTEVNDIMKTVPEGKLITIDQIRKKLAEKHHATIGCPLTIGIFAWISAHAANEDALNGKKDITPFWRTLKTGGIINEKYPGGIDYQKQLLEREGHKVIQKRKKFIVQDYEKVLVE